MSEKSKKMKIFKIEQLWSKMFFSDIISTKNSKSPGFILANTNKNKFISKFE